MHIRLFIILLLSACFIASHAQNFEILKFDTVYEHSANTEQVDKSKVRIICSSCYTCNTVYLIEGLPIVQGELMPTLNTNDIDSVAVDREIHPNVRLIEIFTKRPVNTGLRHIRDKTNYHTRTHPGCILILDNKAADNKETKEQLLRLTKDDIKSVKLKKQKQVIKIKTKRRNRDLIR